MASGQREAREIFELITSFTSMVESLAAKSLSGYGLFWNRSFTPDFFSYSETETTKCEIAMSLAYRVKLTWGVAAILTNYTTEKMIPDNGRGYFTDVLSIDSSGNPRAIEYSIPVCSNGNFSFYKNSPGIIETWTGKPSWSHFAIRSLRENPALKNALQILDESQIAEEFVESSESASNMAILLLPVSLALVPLGLFQDVSLLIALACTLAIDIFSVLPVAIKGMELLLGDVSKFNVVSYVYGEPGSEKFTVAETWAATCKKDAGYREKGIALLATAISAMIIGIILEFATRAKLAKYRDMMKSDLDIQYHDELPSLEGGGLLWHMRRRRLEDQ